MAAVASALRALTRWTVLLVAAPDEVMRLSPHLQLLRVQGQPMTLAAKLRYFADPEFAGLFDPAKGAAA